MKRPLVALIALVVALAGSGQSCFTVLQPSHGAVVPGCAVWCLDGEGPWLTDREGYICVRTVCDSVRIEKPGFASRMISLADANATGVVQLTYAVRELDPVEVEPWPRKRDRQALAATGIVDSSLIAGFERSSLRSAALFTPGVQWDERGHGGSMRVSIRGSLLRSPYGVRGVKVYWGPFPLTLADGSTPLELLDPMLVGSLDIVRSVGSPMYGSAPSGLLLGNAPFRQNPGTDASVEATGGPYGYYRLGVSARTNKGPLTFTTGVIQQRSDGYRAQESSARDQAFISARMKQKRGTTQVFLTWQKAAWDLPGSVDKTIAEEDPRAARPYSVLLDAHIEKEQLMGGLANELRLGEHLKIRSSVHGQLIDKTNPYGTSAANCGYKEETVRAVGVRLSIGSDRLLILPTAWDIGFEALSERDHLRELYYVDKVRGDIKVNGDTRVANLNAFATTVTRLGRSTTLHLGAGTERTSYHHEDHVAMSTSTRTTTPALLPYAGLEQRLGQGYQLHLRYAESLSRATVWELLGTTGRFNSSLRGERVREWEVGAAAGSDSSRIQCSISAYFRSIDQLIQATEGDLGTTYSNRGSVNIPGIEVALRATMIRSMTSRLIGHGNLSVQQNPDGPGAIVGIPGITAGARLQYLLRGSSCIELGVRGATSALAFRPFVGDGLERVKGYRVLHARIEHRFLLGSGGLSLFAHCENLLDVRYSSWIQVNDPGGRFYNPAPGRSFFFGVRFVFGRSKAKPTD